MGADNTAQIILGAVDQTAAAFDSAKKNLLGLQQQALATAGQFGSLGGIIKNSLIGFGVGAIAKSFTDIIDGAIQTKVKLYDLSLQTGISVTALGALSQVAKLSNTDLDSVASASNKLSKALFTQAEDSKGAAQAVAALGLNFDKLKGQTPDQQLLTISKALAGFEDGAGKAAAAQLLFGKTGAQLLPFLAELAEKETLVSKQTLESAKAAKQYEDDIKELTKASNEWKLELVNGVLPALTAIVQQLLDGRKAYGGFLSAIVDIGINVDPFKSVGANLASTREELGKYETELDAVNKRQTEGGIAATLLSRSDAKRKAFLEGEIKLLQSRDSYLKSQQAREALALGSGVTDRFTPRKGVLNLPTPPDGTAAAAFLATLKKNLDGSLQAIQQNLQNEQDLLKFNENFTQAVYNNGNASLATFYEVQDALRQRGLDEQKKAFNDSIAAELAYQAKLPKDSTGDAARAESANKIAAARAKISAAEREALQQRDLSRVERPAALDAQQRQVDAFNATLQDIIDGGRTRAAELADIANRVESARKLLVQGGADDATVKTQTDALRAQLTLQHDFNVARDDFTTITDRASAAEEALQLIQRSSGIGLLEGEQQIHALREQELVQLGKLLEATRALANVNPQNEALQKGLRDLEIAYGRLKEAADPTKLRLDGAADNIGDAIASGLSRANTEGKNLRKTISGIGTQIVDIVEKELVTKPLSQSIANFVKGTGGQGAGENLIGKLLGLNSPKNASIAADPTAQLSASLNALQASGVDPATEALTRLQQAAEGAAGAIGGASPATPGFGPAGGYDFGGSNTTGEQSIKDLFKTVDDAQSSSADALGKSTDATGRALTQLAASAIQGGGALSLLPQIVSLVTSAAASNSVTAGSSGGGFLGWLGGLFGGGGPTSAGGAGSYVSGAAGSASTVGMSLHTGGIVGMAGARTPIDPAAFQYARRYHSGGIAGLKPDEVPAVLMGGPKGKREEVLHASDPRHSDNGGMRKPGDTYQSFDMRGLTVDSHGAMDRMSEDRAARNIAMKAQRYLSRRGA